MMDSFDTADKILEDLANDAYIKTNSDKELEFSNAMYWDKWEKLNTYELEKGEALGKSRLKVCNKDEMLDVMK